MYIGKPLTGGIATNGRGITIWWWDKFANYRSVAIGWGGIGVFLSGQGKWQWHSITIWPPRHQRLGTKEMESDNA